MDRWTMIYFVKALACSGREGIEPPHIAAI